MERDTNDLVELGNVTADAAGDIGLPIEMGGREHWAGLQQD